MKKRKPSPVLMQRRCFMSNCLKLSAGVTLLGMGSKVFGDTLDSYLDYGYCIFKCPQPCSFAPSCPGCREATSGPALNCTARICALEKEMPSCAHCAELATCDKDIFVNYPAQRTFALNKQKEWGLLPDSHEALKVQREFKVYPTITSDNIAIDNYNNVEVDFNLFDIKGQIVKKGKFSSGTYLLNVSDLNPGNYILNITKKDKLLYLSKITKN